MTTKLPSYTYGYIDDTPPQDWTDYELADLDVPEMFYNEWRERCLRNKSRTSWVYFTKNDGTKMRRKVKYSLGMDVMTYNGQYKGQWGFINKIV